MEEPPPHPFLWFGKARFVRVHFKTPGSQPNSQGGYRA